jgi:hypothetical protein
VDADPVSGTGNPSAQPVVTNTPPPPPPGDTAAQVPTLGQIKVTPHHGRLVARVPVICPTSEAGGCRTTLTLTTAKRLRRGKVRAAPMLGSKQVNLRPGQRSTVSIPLARGAAAFARRGTLATRVRITSFDAAGNSATRSVARRLRIPRL